MNDFQVFIHPSCHTKDHDSEGGAPAVLLDAQATGMPVISTFHCDIPEEVILEKTGILVQESDVDAISNAINFFYAMDDAEYQRFAIYAREHVINEFSIQKNVKELEKIYFSLVQRLK